MAVIKCKMCGGNINLNENQNIGICDSCGSTITVPNIDDEKIINLFDKALSTYENILSEHDNNKETHFSSVNKNQLKIGEMPTSNFIIYKSNDDIVDYIFNIVLNKKPEQIKILMFSTNNEICEVYNNFSHLLIPIIANDNMKYLGALSWLCQELEYRNTEFKKMQANNLELYNEISDKQLPQIIVLIDDFYKWINYFDNQELEDVIENILNIDRKNANKYGIQIVGTTIYNMKDIELGKLKVFFNSVYYDEFKNLQNKKYINMSRVDLLNENRKLLKQYELIEDNTNKPQKMNDDNKEEEFELVKNLINEIGKKENFEFGNNNFDIYEFFKQYLYINEEYDEYLMASIEIILEEGQVSTSSIQRKFKVGYARAGRIIEQLEALGIISECQGSRPRTILINTKELEFIVKINEVIKENYTRR